jgi:hypothetical protein
VHSINIMKIAALLVGSLVLLACGESAHAFSSCFSTTSPNQHRHPLPDFARSQRISKQEVVLHMAKPGQSEAQQRQERENEIRSKMAKLKAAGRMDKGGDGSASMMNEAEAFFNKDNPVRRRKKAAEALLKKQQEEEESKGTEDDSVSSE